MRRWSNTASLVKTIHELPPNRCSSGWRAAKYCGNGLLVAGPDTDTRIAFLLVPPVASNKPIEDWDIPSPLLPGQISHRAAYLPENVIAVSEEGEGCVNLCSLFVQRLDD